MAKSELTCPACGSALVLFHSGDAGTWQECPGCGARWSRLNRTSRRSRNASRAVRDPLAALRHDRFKGREPGVLWRREA